MESVRDVKRAMEREIAKGSSPLKLDHIEFGDYSYQEIMLQEKLFEVLTYLLRMDMTVIGGFAALSIFDYFNFIFVMERCFFHLKSC